MEDDTTTRLGASQYGGSGIVMDETIERSDHGIVFSSEQKDVEGCGLSKSWSSVNLGKADRDVGSSLDEKC